MTQTDPDAWTQTGPDHDHRWWPEHTSHLNRGAWPSDEQRLGNGQWPDPDGYYADEHRGGDRSGGRGPAPTGTYPQDRPAYAPEPGAPDPREAGRGSRGPLPPYRGEPGAGTAGVVGPPLHRRAGVWPGRVLYTPDTGSADPLWWWVGAHGSAGVGALTAVLRCSADAGRCWPSAPWGECPNVVLVARTHLQGLRHAQDLAAQHAAGLVPAGVRLLGLVTVADAPGRLPTELRRLRDLVAAAVPHAWHLPWMPDWRLSARDTLPGFDPAREPTPTGRVVVPAEYAACGRELAALVMSCTVGDLPTRDASASSRVRGRRGRRSDHPGASTPSVPTTSKEN